MTQLADKPNTDEGTQGFPASRRAYIPGHVLMSEFPFAR